MLFKLHCQELEIKSGVSNVEKVVLIGATNYGENCKIGKELLERHGFSVIENPYQRPLTKMEQKKYLSEICAVSSGNEVWDREMISKAPNLKIISRFGVGYDNIDVEACQKAGITVATARGMNSDAVANMAVTMILALMKDLVFFDRTTREGQWARKMGTDITGKRIGLLGFGDIAQRVAKKLSGFDVEIFAYDTYPNQSRACELNVTFVDIDTLLTTCDAVSCHLPSLPETYHIINEDSFNKMKSSAVFVNTARGPIVDERALYNALKNKTISRAAIDVYEQEPVSRDNPLLTLENIIVTPHTSAESFEAFERVGLNTAQDIVNYFEGKNPHFSLTPNPFEE